MPKLKARYLKLYVETKSTGFGMDWNSWIGRRVKIVLADGYTKYGMFIGADAHFIEIEYETTKGHERVAISQIASIKEHEGRQ